MKNNTAFISFKNEVPVYYDELLRYALRLTRNNDEAQDLVQETLYKAISNYEKFKLGTNVRAWLHKILYYQFCSQYRKSSNSKAHAIAIANVEKHKINNVTYTESIITKEEIISFIDNLDKRYKIMSLLYFLKEYSYSEIEGLTKLKLGTIKSRIFRCRKLLREEIKNKIENRTYQKAV